MIGFKKDCNISPIVHLFIFITYSLIIIKLEKLIITQNIDNQFLKKTKTDYETTDQSLNTTVASVHTRQIQQISAIANDLYTRVDIPEPFRMDAKAFIERPFFVENVSFNTTSPRYLNLALNASLLPGDIIRSNPSLLNAMKMAAYYRANLVLNISMAGTIVHAGCVLVGVIPPSPTTLNSIPHKDLINTILSGPHGFLYANEATSITLEVPWYCNSDLATLDLEKNNTYVPSLDITPVNGNYATLVMLVLNPLTASGGSSTDIAIVVEACFRALDIVVPTPRFVEWEAQSFIFNGLKQLGTGLLNQGASGLKEVAGDAIDSVRQAIFGWTGLHNPNVATIQQRVIVTDRNFNNTVDSQQFFEKLDPFSQSERILEAPNFGTQVDEMRIPHITAKKQMIGSFQVSVTDTVGKLFWSRPISPYQGGMDPTTPYIANNIELLHRISRAWRGGLNIHLVSVMNNKQQVKLRALKMYNPSMNSTFAYPKYASIVNAPSDLIEFTQGGQEHIIKLPYLCRNDVTPCSREYSFEALFHGMYYIYLAQPLINSDNSPSTIEFNVFISGDEDLTFYGYSTETTIMKGFSDFVPDNFSIITKGKEIKPPAILKTVKKRQVDNTKFETTLTDYKTVLGETLLQIAKKHDITVHDLRTYNRYLLFKDNQPIKTVLTIRVPQKKVIKKEEEETTTKVETTPETKIPSIPIKDKLKLVKTKLNAFNNMQGRNMNFEETEQQDEQLQQYLEEREGNSLSSSHIDDSDIDFEDDTEVFTTESTVQELLDKLPEIPSDNIMDNFIKWKGIARKRKKVKCSTTCVCEMMVESLNVMNEPQEQDSNDMAKDRIVDFNHIDRLQPNVDIRPYIRRIYKHGAETLTVPSSATVTTYLPVSSLIGEDPTQRIYNSTPLSIVSNMYYGKNAGFKVKIRMMPLSSDLPLFNHMVNIRYLPPNMTYLTSTHTVTGCVYNTQVQPDPTPYSGGQITFPLPYQTTPVTSNEATGAQLFEFVIPDVTLYKFMGSPNKLLDSTQSFSQLSTMDFGNIIISVTNQLAQLLTIGVEIFVGLTDETRMGYHSIAPRLDIPTYEVETSLVQSSMYAGESTGYNNPLLAARNGYIYKGGFL